MQRTRVCAYLRKSRDDGYGETVDETLARHRKVVDSMASALGVEIADYYTEVVSGESIEDRPQMIRLLNDLKARRWDLCVVVEISRLSRGDGSDRQTIVNAFRLTKTQVLSEFRRYDLDNPDDLDQFESKLESSRREYKAIVARLQRGIKRSVMDGWYLSMAPYGYDKVRLGRKQCTLAPNADADNVRMMYGMACDGASVGEIRRRLHELGVRSPKGREMWSKSTIRTLLANPLYYGMVRWGYRREEDYLKDDFGCGTRTVLAKEEDVTLVEGRHEGLVTKEVFDRADACLHRERPKQPRLPLSNPLAGILVCGKCGCAMTRRPIAKRGTAYFLHPEWSFECEGCKSARAEDVMRVLVETLERDVAHYEFAITDAGLAREREKQEALVKEMERALADAKERRIENFDRLERNVISEDMYRMSEERNVALIAELEESIERERGKLVNPADFQTMVVTSREVIRAMNDDSLTPEQQNRIIRELVSRIEYRNDAPRRTKEHDIRLDIFLR